MIGSGGFAWVYRAFDPELEIPVAVKVLKPQYAGDEKFEERFRREASTAAKLRHPNIIKIYAVGREGDAVYFAMDYLPTGLADRLAVMTTLPEPMLIRMGIDVASALGFAHREGVIHRDIKTDNILFDEHGNAIVADFGIARAVSSYVQQTGTNMVVGTPQYFSPEQARGLALDGRADLYSLGVTLFKAATGELPFQGTDWYEIARQHVEEKPPRPRSINPALSREMDEIILRLLEKDPENRPPTGDALVEELMHLLAERGEATVIKTSAMPAAVTVSNPGVPYAARRRRARRLHRAWWIGGGAAAVALIAAAAVWRGRQEPETAAAATRASAGDGTAPVAAAGQPGLAARPPLNPSLVVTVPPGAELALNGIVVAHGPWRTDSLTPGTYQLAASVNAPASCRWRREEQTVTLAAGQTSTVELRPRGCGTVTIRSRPARAAYVLSGPGVSLEGQLPLAAPLNVPAGVYHLQITAPLCAQYINDKLRVRPMSETPLTVNLLCGT